MRAASLRRSGDSPCRNVFVDRSENDSLLWLSGLGGHAMITTIGYERATLDDFIATLQISEIEVLVDVRDRAQSRRPGFSKGALSQALHEAGISYLHLPRLGDPKEGREAARRGDYDKFREIFAGVLASNEAKIAIKELEELAAESRICLMCFERDQLTCHRKIVSDLLDNLLGGKTKHLGVQEGAAKRPSVRRMSGAHQSAAAPI